MLLSNVKWPFVWSLTAPPKSLRRLRWVEKGRHKIAMAHTLAPYLEAETTEPTEATEATEHSKHRANRAPRRQVGNSVSVHVHRTEVIRHTLNAALCLQNYPSQATRSHARLNSVWYARWQVFSDIQIDRQNPWRAFGSFFHPVSDSRSDDVIFEKRWWYFVYLCCASCGPSIPSSHMAPQVVERQSRPEIEFKATLVATSWVFSPRCLAKLMARE